MNAPIQPYAAWYFVGADNIDEVDREYAAAARGDADGFTIRPQLTCQVKVIGLEYDQGEYVWVIPTEGPDQGRAVRRDSWLVRKVPE